MGPPPLFPLWIEQLLLDSTGGANASAGAAIDASVGIDLVLASALRDSANRALASAGAAGDASVSNLVSHGVTPFSPRFVKDFGRSAPRRRGVRGPAGETHRRSQHPLF